MHTVEQHPDRPTDDQDWRQDAEKWICRIQGVRQCKIDLDAEGEISGIHVVAVVDRDARHVVRDVESLLKARLGISVNYKKIGVAQVVETEPPVAEAPASAPTSASAPAAAGPSGAAGPHILDLGSASQALLVEEAPAPRMRCEGVSVTTTDSAITVTVDMAAGDVHRRGQASGPNHPGGDMHLIGRAAVDAVLQLVEDPVVLSLSEIREADIGGEPVVLAAVELVEGRRSDRLFGTCSLRQNPQQAAVFAVLDALNRRLSLMAFKEERP